MTQPGSITTMARSRNQCGAGNDKPSAAGDGPSSRRVQIMLDPLSSTASSAACGTAT
ncbi:hypothethical protein (plasmid) [Ralstonia solanacearum CMR15]|nr:hypothethical protein [Ralstonia solanacearum CMR15]